MWTRVFSRLASPAVQRSACASRPRRTPRGPEWAQAPLPSPLPSLHLREQQSLSSVSHPQVQHLVRSVRALNEERMVEVEWEDGGCSLFPFTWLRDNCQCPLCTLDSAQARKLLLSNVDINTGVDAVELTSDGHVSVVWPEKHTSVFKADWLKRRCFSAAARRALQEEFFLNERVYWDATLQMPTADFHEVLHDDKVALAWLLALRRVGIVYLRGAPAEEGQVARLVERIGYLRLTFYGHTWHVKDKPMANNVAYTSGMLIVHTDYPALHFAPGVQFLHCISQAAEGGESQVVDGFHMAEQLRKEDPEAFRILTSTLVDFTDTGEDYCDFMLQSKKCIIDVDLEGRVKGINYNNATRDSVLDLPVDQVQPFYRALRTYVDIMTRPENMVTYRMESGERTAHVKVTVTASS